MKDKEEYLGDGLYVSFDGFGVRLRAPRENEDHHVYLEPVVYKSFEQYMRRLTKWIAESKAKEESK